MTFQNFQNKNAKRTAMILWSYKTPNFLKQVILSTRKTLKSLNADRFYFGNDRQMTIKASEYRIFNQQ